MRSKKSQQQLKPNENVQAAPGNDRKLRANQQEGSLLQHLPEVPEGFPGHHGQGEEELQLVLRELEHLLRLPARRRPHQLPRIPLQHRQQGHLRSHPQEAEHPRLCCPSLNSDRRTGGLALASI